MIRVSKSVRNELERVGLLRFRKDGLSPVEPNLVVTNREHVGKNVKTYYVVEEPEILLYLQMYDTLNLQKIKPDQVQMLLNKGLITNDSIQLPREYKPNAVVFRDDAGQYRCKKVTNIMIALGYWKAKK